MRGGVKQHLRWAKHTADIHPPTKSNNTHLGCTCCIAHQAASPFVPWPQPFPYRYANPLPPGARPKDALSRSGSMRSPAQVMESCRRVSQTQTLLGQLSRPGHGWGELMYTAPPETPLHIFFRLCPRGHKGANLLLLQGITCSCCGYGSRTSSLDTHCCDCHSRYGSLDTPLP